MEFEKEKINIAVIGLGYVGLPLAIEFSKKFKVVGFDIDSERIDELNRNFDRTNEYSQSEIAEVDNLFLTCKEKDIEKSNIYIITVPTPVDKNKKPDLGPLEKASEMVGNVIKNENIVIFESLGLIKRLLIL